MDILECFAKLCGLIKLYKNGISFFKILEDSTNQGDAFDPQNFKEYACT
jgi:hypothetical protein